MELYNLEMIESMCHGNKEQVVAMVKVFVEEMDKFSNEFKEACFSNNMDSVGKLLHKVKPTLTYYGTRNLNELIQEFDSEFKSTNKIAITKVEAIEKHVQDVISKMKLDFDLT